MRSYDVTELVEFVPLTDGGIAIEPKRSDSPCMCKNMQINQPLGIACPDCGRPL